MIAIERSSQISILVVSGLFAAISTVSVCLRFYARRVKGNPVKSDDWCILVALVSTVQDEDTSNYSDRMK